MRVASGVVDAAEFYDDESCPNSRAFHRRRHGRGRDASLRAGCCGRPVCYAGRPGTGGDCRYAAGDAGSHDGAGLAGVHRRRPAGDDARPVAHCVRADSAAICGISHAATAAGRYAAGQYTDAATAAADVAAYGNTNTNANRTAGGDGHPGPVGNPGPSGGNRRG